MALAMFAAMLIIWGILWSDVTAINNRLPEVQAKPPCGGAVVLTDGGSVKVDNSPGDDKRVVAAKMSGQLQADNAAIWPAATNPDCLTQHIGWNAFQRDTPWNTPFNISRSGGTSAPRMIRASDGLFHVIWEDEVDGFYYSSGDGETWSESEAVELPFGTRSYYPDLKDTDPTPLFTPTLLEDAGGNVHAFWIDSEDILYRSSVSLAEFGNFSSWSDREELALSVTGFDVAIDQTGLMHITYVRSRDDEGEPAGIYYRNSGNAEIDWSEPALLYGSRYYRTLETDEINVQIATAALDDVNYVYVVWDNPALGRVLFRRSADGGLNWDQLLVVDGRAPEDDVASVSPSKLSIGASDKQIVLTWNAGHGEAPCSQFYRYSIDNGATWSDRERLATSSVCHLQSTFLNSSDGVILLMARMEEITGENVYLLAWDENRWSDPQIQPTLAKFQNPESFQTVNYRCQEAMVVNDNQMSVIGCEVEGSADIWFTSRQLDDIDQWFPIPLIWQPLSLIAESSSKPIELDLVSDLRGAVHAVWSREDGSAIYYAQWDGQRWTQPAPIVRSPEGRSDHPALAMDAAGRLLLVWSDSDSGKVYFSVADSEQALLPSDWSLPSQMSGENLQASSPKIAIDPDGTIFVVYPVPLNEGRGLFMTSSVDGGTTWADEWQIFDGSASEWARVDYPQLTISTNGSLHILWSRFSQPFGEDPEGFYYARSEDHGNSWSDPALVAERPATWARLVSTVNDTIYRLWLAGDDHSALLHQISNDGGQTWSTPVGTTGFTTTQPPQAAVTADFVGHLHLLRVTEGRIRHWTWQDNRWLVADDAFLNPNETAFTGPLGSTINSNGDLVIVYAGDEEASETSGVYFTKKSVELPELPPTPVPTATPTTEPTPSPTASPTPVPTATPALPAVSPSNDGSGARQLPTANPVLRTVLAFLPVILVVFLLALLTTTRWRRR